MVKIINCNGVTCVESYIRVDQEIAQVLKDEANKKFIEDMCKDLHVKCRLEERDNAFMSVLGMQIDDEMDGSIVFSMNTNHHQLIDAVIHFNEKRTTSIDDHPKAKPEEARSEEADIDELPAVIQKLMGKCAAIVIAIPKNE